MTASCRVEARAVLDQSCLHGIGSFANGHAELGAEWLLLVAGWPLGQAIAFTTQHDGTRVHGHPDENENPVGSMQTFGFGPLTTVFKACIP